MDLLAKRYASPFILLEQMICQQRFCEFVIEVNTIVYEESEDAKYWDIWLHKIFDNRSFNDWKKSVTAPRQIEVDESELEATIRDSKELLDNFNPTDRG